ncbi:hypothetical protein HYT84_02950 [Candidatus Micrarchaeota archaeon]|nr:hypothetical protein [Candidatus Micrarchaeota archaeon]
MIELKQIRITFGFMLILLISLAFAATKDYTFDKKVGIADVGIPKVNTNIKNNAFLQISVSQTKVLKANNPDSLGDFGSSDVICPTTGSTKAVITDGWAVSKFDAQSAYDPSGSVPNSYNSFTQQPIKWISLDELTKLKDCDSDVFFDSGKAKNKDCYNYIKTNLLSSQKATYIADYDFQLNTPKQYPNREGLANVYCSGNAVLKDGSNDLTKEGSYDLIL